MIGDTSSAKQHPFLVTDFHATTAEQARFHLPLYMGAKPGTVGALRGFTVAALVLAGATPWLSPTSDAPTASVLSGDFAPPLITVEMPTRYLNAAREMKSYSALEARWDGPGSERPAEETIESALLFLANLPDGLRSPDATASADGTVGWFWKTSDLFASVTFLREGRFSYYAKKRSTGESAKGVEKLESLSIPSDFLRLISAA